jgi:hypothetical protein
VTLKAVQAAARRLLQAKVKTGPLSSCFRELKSTVLADTKMGTRIFT